MKTWTNEQAFSFYRRALAQDFEWAKMRDLLGARDGAAWRLKPVEVPLDPRRAAFDMFRSWQPKYGHRRDAIRGFWPMYIYARSRLADVPAQQGLIERHRQRDGAESALPDHALQEGFAAIWGAVPRTVAANAGIRLDAKSLADLHRYGPSLRALWAQAKRTGLSDEEAFQHVIEWGCRPPPEPVTVLSPGSAASHFRRKLGWERSGDLEMPWSAAMAGERWQVRLNDFPDEPMYRLVIDGTPIGDFHDWPKRWQRPDDPHAIAAPSTVRRGKSESGAAVRAIGNREAFDIYRERVEPEIRDVEAWRLAGEPSYESILRPFRDILVTWLARYKRRQEVIAGSIELGIKLADTVAWQALVTRNRERDAAATELPDWDKAIRFYLDTYDKTHHWIMYKQPSPDERRVLDGFSITALVKLHDYGPSMRQLWGRAKRSGVAEAEAWRAVVDWAVHRPAAWRAEEMSPTLVQCLAREAVWQDSGDRDFPWRTEIDGARWRVRLNDFPDAPMYGLTIGEDDLGDFYDWPASWRRPG